MSERVCAVQGCGKELTAANKSGRCTKHFYVPKGQRKAAAPAAVTVKAKPVRLAPEPKLPVEEPVEIRVTVTPAWLDMAWSRLDPHQKAAAIAAVLVA